LKTKTLKISLRGTHIEVDDGKVSQVFGVLQLKALYIHNAIELSISDCYGISQYLKVYFINARGKVVGEYVRSDSL